MVEFGSVIHNFWESDRFAWLKESYNKYIQYRQKSKNWDNIFPIGNCFTVYAYKISNRHTYVNYILYSIVLITIKSK